MVDCVYSQSVANLNTTFAVMAGYLFFPNTADLKNFIADSDIIQTWMKQREVGFQVPDFKDTYLFALKKLWELLEKADRDLILDAALPLNANKTYQHVSDVKEAIVKEERGRENANVQFGQLF